MGFVGVYTAIYDYHPQSEGELDIREGDLLYILEKSTQDDWWKAKKKANREDEEEPEGLVPCNYVEEAHPISKAKALYDYTRQTEEEVSFSEDAELLVYDVSDPDWTLVRVHTEFGFAPSNYIEIGEPIKRQPAAVPAEAEPEPEPAAAAAPALPRRPSGPASDDGTAGAPASNAAQNPAAAAIAGILHKQHGSVGSAERPRSVPPPPEPARQPSPEEDEEEASAPPPALPRRPPSEQRSPPARQPSPPEPAPRPRSQLVARVRESEGHVQESPPYNRVGAPRSPSGYHLYNINEMVEVMGKRKKMPTTLGINIATGTIFISPDTGDARHQEWTADKLAHYSIEGKHVFMDLVRPSKSVDFHAGAKDTAREIVSALGEIAGGYRAEGLREVIEAGITGGGARKKGQVLYDFMAQGDDEVTVAVGDEVVILDDTKSEEWWMVRRIKNGREGVVPSSYIEITGLIEAPPSTGLSSVEKNRLEEARLTKEATQRTRRDSMDSRSERPKPERSEKESTGAKSKPDPAKTRKWTDRTGTFTVEAQFLGLNDGKIHLHKTNGVKIAVPIAKMSVEDLEYVEKITGESLDEDKPLSDIRRRSVRQEAEKPKHRPAPAPGAGAGRAGARVEQHDWFDFFLKAGVGPHQCERYSQNFNRDFIDESILPDVTPETLRTLGLKEGDILRVMRYLDNLYGRTGAKSKTRNVSFGGEEVIEGEGGLFSGPGGALRNNTRKARPAPAVPASDVVDPKAFERQDASKPAERAEPSASAASSGKPVTAGFDDDAWEVKRPEQATTSTAASTAAPSSPARSQAPQQPTLTGAMADLSLLTPPLQPTPAQPTTTSQPVSAPAPAPAAPAPVSQPLQPQPTGASPSFFSQLGPPGQQGLTPQPTGFQQQQQQQQQQMMPPRQRPQPPQPPNVGQTLIPPPPQRPLSAPQNFPQPSSFGPPPLQPQLTGIPSTAPHIAPPGQSLNELNQQRFQQQQQFQPGFGPFANGLAPQATGFGQGQFGFAQQPQQAQPFLNGAPPPGFPGLAPQPTGFAGFAPQQPMATGINSVLPPPLQPQRTGANGFGGSNNTPSPPLMSQPLTSQALTATAPLQPQKTGPPPPVRFGVNTDSKKLTPQPTGLRANLAQATPSNPFGF
ncbi:hypothetical protein VTN02DRAFT_6621 [Thermoascus thermophilus]